ncbi:MAG: hypothetical protein LC127_11755, partial [Chitinophagales bacterium]|nr:hypothetical protein [Chitinophagales bacterium]
WLRVRHFVKDMVHKEGLPDLETVLFLIGVQELGQLPKEKFTKEEKQDLMHIAVCTLLEPEGFYRFEGKDGDGWPHWKELKPFNIKGADNQEAYLIDKIIQYFDKYIEQ